MRQEPERASGSPGFFARRWRGDIAIDRLFWFDMMLVATLINIATAFISLMMFGLKLPAWIAVAAFLAPLPYNIFLVLAVWRTTEQMPANAASAYRAGALIWLVAAVII